MWNTTPKQTGVWEGVEKTSGSFATTDKTTGVRYLMIDDTFFLLLDNENRLILQTSESQWQGIQKTL
jgi:hypothetical protein